MRDGGAVTAEECLREALASHDRVAIAGGPRTGKTTLAALALDRPVIHTDDYMDVGWDGIPGAVIKATVGHPRFLVEGVQVARALRAGLEVDAVLWLIDAKVPLTPKQAAMAQGIARVFWTNSLSDRVKVYRPDRTEEPTT